MKIDLRLIFNSGSQIVSRVVSSASILLITYLITNNLSREIWGDFVTTTSFVAMFTLIADFGLNAVVVKKIIHQESEEAENFRQILGFRIVLSIFSMFAALAVLAFLPHTAAVKLGIIVGVWLILAQSLFNTTAIAFQIKHRWDQFALADIVGSIATVLLIFIAIYFHLGLLSVVGIFVIGYAAKALVGLFLAGKLINFSGVGINTKIWRAFAFASLPLGLTVVFSQINANIDKQILALTPAVAGLASAAAVGIYGLAYRFFDFAIALPTYLVNAAYPAMLSSHKENREEFASEIRSFALLFFGVGLILLIVGEIFAPVVFSFFPKYSASLIPLRILLLGLPIFFVSSLLFWSILTVGKEIFLPFIYGLGTLANVVLNLIFIPKFGYNAAAWITILSEVVILVGLFWVLRDLNLIKFNEKTT